LLGERHRNGKKKEMDFKNTAELKEMKALETLNKIYEEKALVQKFFLLGYECWASDSEQFVIWCRCPQCKDLVKFVKTNNTYPTWLVEA
jgi:hypothetical protein